jgi:glycosyltransferase involved in cell wall biosynthesis
MPAISVILPTRDRAALLPRALASVLRQTWTDFEVVLIDNNQTSPPVRENPLVTAWLADPRVVVMAGRAAASAAAVRNVALGVARGDWITYLDDDDEYHPEKLAAQFDLARVTGAPLVLCGYTVVLPRRRRTRQVQATEFRGDALLLEANWGAPFLFHRRDPAARFDETLTAGEDTPFALSFLQRHHATVVPNCARSLVEVYPQLDAPRVHRDGAAIWRSVETTVALVESSQSLAARRGYLAMGRLFRAQFGYGNIFHFLRCASAALVTLGPHSWRLVVNATARRLGWFKRWVVS